MEMTNAVFGQDVCLLKLVWGYKIARMGGVFFDFVWGNVSERYLRVCRILLDYHHVPEFSDLYLRDSSGAEDFEIGLEYNDGVVSEDRRLRIFDEVES